MSVRHSLLAILDQGPCYGYQLRAEFERRTGGSRPLNVGQIYNTLDRLERDGLVAKGDTDEHGHVYFEITPEGRSSVRTWLAAPIERAGAPRDELAVKIALSSTLPGVDVRDAIRTQHRASAAVVAELRAHLSPATAGSDTVEELSRRLVDESALVRAEAELRWLERADELVSGYAASERQSGVSAERPRRGRPPGAPRAARSR